MVKYYCMWKGHLVEVPEGKVRRKCSKRNIGKKGIPPGCEFLLKEGETEKFRQLKKAVERKKGKRWLGTDFKKDDLLLARESEEVPERLLKKNIPRFGKVKRRRLKF